MFAIVDPFHDINLLSQRQTHSEHTQVVLGLVPSCGKEAELLEHPNDRDVHCGTQP
ncbi:MAG: hypothetical protein NTW75_05470 [Planctomycetales bacterium]|nr:hypothetical protein [Planctomycetales bacterium]